MNLTLAEERKLWANVEIDDAPACWPWTGGIRQSGYGRLHLRGAMPYAHRLVYEILVGPIADGLQIDHLCRNRACVNPDHLEPVTQAVNILRGDGWSGLKSRQTHCIHGHAFTEANTAYRHGRRRCKECRRVPKPEVKP